MCANLKGVVFDFLQGGQQIQVAQNDIYTSKKNRLSEPKSGLGLNQMDMKFKNTEIYQPNTRRIHLKER